jgi:hypothetical protein
MTIYREEIRYKGKLGPENFQTLLILGFKRLIERLYESFALK